jgi:hypothetical protein
MAVILSGLLLAGVSVMSHGYTCLSDEYIDSGIELIRQNKLDDWNDMMIDCIGTDSPQLYRTIIGLWMDKDTILNNQSIYQRNKNVILLIKTLMLSNSKGNYSSFLAQIYDEGNSVVKKNYNLHLCWKDADQNQDKIIGCYYQSNELLSLPYIPLEQWHTQLQSQQPSRP